MNLKDIILIGYSGHSYVIIDALSKSNSKIIGYCDTSEKISNPFDLKYLGTEDDYQFSCKEGAIVAIGDNRTRQNIYNFLENRVDLVLCIHPSAKIGLSVKLGEMCVVLANAIINPLATIGNGVIINSGAIVEHECNIGNFAHLAPGAVIAGSVYVGERSFIGAKSVVKQGIRIGNDVTIGAGSVIIRDIPDGTTVVGNPGRVI